MAEEKPTGEPRLADELAAIPHEPLLPVEKKLIGGSLLLGTTLLGILYWVSHTYFPVPGPEALPAKPTAAGK
jgi:hypothetical protein